MHLRLFRENTSEDTYAAETLEEAKKLFRLTDEDAEPTDWEEVPDHKRITVDCDGTKVVKTAVEWANETSEPGYRFGVNY